MAQLDDLEARVAAVEARVADLAQRVQRSEQDAAAARVLAGAADRDVTEVREEIRDFRRAAMSGFNAMRADLTDLRQHMTTGFIEVRGRLDAAAAGQQRIVDLLTAVLERPEPPTRDQ